jgi:hypothetical protein
VVRLTQQGEGRSMTASLLTSVGYAWQKRPHRLHTLRVGPEADGGIEIVGGPWTTGVRGQDGIDAHTSWEAQASRETSEVALAPTKSEGFGVAEVRWAVPDAGSLDVVAVIGFSLRSVSHPDGFNIAGLGTGVDRTASGWEAWVRVEVGKVPDRPEHFDFIVIEAAARVAVIRPGHDPVRILRIEAGVRTRAGIRPRHRPIKFDIPGGALGLAGWSWSVRNTPNRRGRYLRGFRFATGPTGIEAWVSNSGELTRPSDLRLTIDAVMARP